MTKTVYILNYDRFLSQRGTNLYFHLREMLNCESSMSVVIYKWIYIVQFGMYLFHSIINIEKAKYLN